MSESKFWQHTDLKKGRIKGLLMARKELVLMRAEEVSPASEAYDILGLLRDKIDELIEEEG